MPNRGDRGGAQTRARIADVATGLFIQHGFEEVTIADVAAAAGVSKVTVFHYFERKEDLLLDRLPDAVDIARSAVRDRAPGTGVVTAMRHAAVRLAEQRHPLSGLAENAEPVMRTFTTSPALIARLRAFEHEIESALADELRADAVFTGDSDLAATLLVAAYRHVAVETVRQRLAGGELDEVARDHQARITAAFSAVEHGIPDG
ncbi:MAG TPA: helix-turn-helix domain-containing protein [Streptosporangiaceae bacterium]|nr:helix-turn-helix domain-containing protein [Streptosporangiaceae bacterium]